MTGNGSLHIKENMQTLHGKNPGSTHIRMELRTLSATHPETDVMLNNISMHSRTSLVYYDVDFVLYLWCRNNRRDRWRLSGYISTTSTVYIHV